MHSPTSKRSGLNGSQARSPSSALLHPFTLFWGRVPLLKQTTAKGYPYSNLPTGGPSKEPIDVRPHPIVCLSIVRNQAQGMAVYGRLLYLQLFGATKGCLEAVKFRRKSNSPAGGYRRAGLQKGNPTYAWCPCGFRLLKPLQMSTSSKKKRHPQNAIRHLSVGKEALWQGFGHPNRSVQATNLIRNCLKRNAPERPKPLRG